MEYKARHDRLIVSLKDVQENEFELAVANLEKDEEITVNILEIKEDILRVRNSLPKMAQFLVMYTSLRFPIASMSMAR